MPLLISTADGKSYLVAGESAPPKPWKAGRLLKTTNLKSGMEISFNLSAIVAVAVWPREQYEAEIKAEAEAAAKVQRLNPNPGHEPRILVPRKPS